MKFLLSVIALCLVMITAPLYIPEAQAKVGGKGLASLIRDEDFESAVLFLVDKKCFTPYPHLNNIRCHPDRDQPG